MPKKLSKIVCPNAAVHKGYEKILLIFRPDLKKFWVHCGDRKCNQWVEIRISKNGGVTLQPMPNDVKFDTEKMTTLVIGGSNVD